MNSPRKRFGQHWLRCQSTLNSIVQAGDLQKSDHILEIGPGKGVLTKKLLPLVENLVAVEIDRDLCIILRNELGKKFDNFLLIEGDILSLDFLSSLSAAPNKVIANIPYNITGPILELLLGRIGKPNPNPYQSIVLLIQKEVAERIVASPGSKAYAALSLKVQYLANCELICHVPSEAFYPPPKVDSAVIRLTPRLPNVTANSPQLLDTLLKLGFASRRKMLRNNLKAYLDLSQIDLILKELEVSPLSRAEELTLEQWINLSNLVGKI